MSRGGMAGVRSQDERCGARDGSPGNASMSRMTAPARPVRPPAGSDAALRANRSPQAAGEFAAVEVTMCSTRAAAPCGGKQGESGKNGAVVALGVTAARRNGGNKPLLWPGGQHVAGKRVRLPWSRLPVLAGRDPAPEAIGVRFT